LFHDGVTLQLRKLQEAAARAEQNDPQGFESKANVKLFRALSHLIMEAVPADPAVMSSAKAIRWAPPTDIGGAKIGRRFRPFFRYDSRSEFIVYAWVNDEKPSGLRAANPIPRPYS